DLGAGFGGAFECVERGEADVLDEEGEFLGIKAVGIPGEAIIASHAQTAAGLEDAPATLRAAFEGLLMAVDDLLREAEFGPVDDAGLFELQARHDRDITFEQHFEPLVVDEGRMLNA